MIFSSPLGSNSISFTAGSSDELFSACQLASLRAASIRLNRPDKYFRYFAAPSSLVLLKNPGVILLNWSKAFSPAHLISPKLWSRHLLTMYSNDCPFENKASVLNVELGKIVLTVSKALVF